MKTGVIIYVVDKESMDDTIVAPLTASINQA